MAGVRGKRFKGRCIKIRGLSIHNLKSLDIDIPLGIFLTITGPSGAGKSSLALDTLYAEAQSRYVETFSPYVRQLLERRPRPPADSIENLPAAIAIGQSNPVRSARSTVASLSDITHPAKLLYWRTGRLHCPECGRPVRKEGYEAVRAFLNRINPGKGYALLTAEVSDAQPERLTERGYFRYLVDGEIRRFEDDGTDIPDPVEIVIDRFDLAKIDDKRLFDACSQGLSLATGLIRLHLPGKVPRPFSPFLHCPQCDRWFDEPGPDLFSFNSPSGACPECQGFGRIMDIDWDLVVPDTSKSIAGGCIKPLENWLDEKEDLLAWCSKQGIDADMPWSKLSEQARREVIFGSGKWYGLKAIFDYLETKRYKPHIRMLLAKYRAYLTCPRCKGTRFRPEALWYKIGGKSISDFYAMDISSAVKWIKGLERRAGDEAAKALVEDISSKLATLEKAGLGYLTLDRQSRTLSGGEVARVSLSKALSSRLTETLFVLDEPTVGLHPIDTGRLIELLRELCSRGNSVIAVEHDISVAASSDLVMELGPGPGDRGGRITFFGPASKWFARQKRKAIAVKSRPRRPEKFIQVSGARANNLKNIDVGIPLKCLTAVCGVSGSGKSTLVDDVLYRGLLRLKGKSTEPPGKFDKITGLEGVDEVVMLDQAPLGRTPRGCPASYLKVLDMVRRCFASTREAREMGLSPGAFSFNTALGQCPVCKGQGSEMVSMQFLPDVSLPCPECGGARLRKDVLGIRYNGRNMKDVLEMTLEEAVVHFGRAPRMKDALGTAIDLGLGYLRLGQPINTLSGGEAQRLKIARCLKEGAAYRRLYILDEPTRGLSHKEVDLLMKALDRLVEAGGTVVTVEHDLQVITGADWVIELGPGGGKEGGRVIYSGPPAGLLQCRESKCAESIERVGKSPQPARPVEPGSRAHGNIEIYGAREHNLKDIDVSVPKKKFVVITGVSGSGKSTLAFDIIFSEGQRRYIESLPAYMRQFVKLYEKPDVQKIVGLTPTVALEQRATTFGAKSTVGTMTEVYHFLRLLYAKASVPICLECGMEMGRQDIEQVAGCLLEKYGQDRITVLVPKVRNRKGWFKPLFEQAVKAGASFARIDGKVMKIPPIPRPSRYKPHTIEVGYGPALFFAGKSPQEAKKFLKGLFEQGHGEIMVLDDDGKEEHFSLSYSCPGCRVSVPEPDPLLFSFNTPNGACARCGGSGMDDSGIRCRACGGSRLSGLARQWRIGNVGIDHFLGLEISEALGLARAWKKSPPFPKRLRPVAMPLLDTIVRMLSFLTDVGLGYLQLNRSGESLSGGETQRIRLAASIGSGLTGITMVLDEPTIGLHPSDNRLLINALKRLCDQGNSVVVVEHDEETIMESDWVIDLGPGGGSKGGEVLFSGPPGMLKGLERTATCRMLARRQRRTPLREPLAEFTNFLEVKGCNFRNLRGADISIPAGGLTVVCGVSGSGKSTFVDGILAPNIRRLLSGREKAQPLYCTDVTGAGLFKSIKRVDHSPIGRTPRSCPATYCKLMDPIRMLLAATPEARRRGFGPSTFSFNVEGGRCKVCKGQSNIKVVLGFLPDVYVKCSRCNGSRFKQEVLKIRWRGKNIADILGMTIEEARELFKPVPNLFRPLSILCELGIGYLALGQPSPTLSGGEAQRIKLGRELISGRPEKGIYLLDEPTTGLHMEDVERLIRFLHKMVDRGATIVVIEHNLDFIINSDWVVELGPAGGKDGGEVLYCGPSTRFFHGSVNTPTSNLVKQRLHTYR